MQRELYHLYSADQQALAQLLVSFVKHGRKQKNQGQEELFPTKTLEHKVRRLTTFIRFGFVQEFPDRQSECTSINLLDKHDAVWGKLYQAIFGAGGPSSAAAKRKLSIEPDDQVGGVARGGARRKEGRGRKERRARGQERGRGARCVSAMAEGNQAVHMR